MKAYIVSGLIWLLLVSCGKEDCFTAPEPVVFEFVDGAGNNLITTGALNPQNFDFRKVTGEFEDVKIDYSLGDDDRITINSFTDDPGVTNYRFYSIIQSFSFSVKAEENASCEGNNIVDVLLIHDDYTEQNMRLFRVTLARQ
ncbi:hypothetical protein [Sphingobacterium hungaricum]|uniref:Uncharacterized protein n=1 Tax=Sphingobacterium hungaricum TaxID=2082723 RepID=A0A928UV45_9SPHI|nr:hypothetical protein [Sphingobacterium hungaricum]MBE8712428.1 hypothetical protein [Sphingobacterium hungaricum]